MGSAVITAAHLNKILISDSAQLPVDIAHAKVLPIISSVVVGFSEYDGIARLESGVGTELY